MRFLFAQIFCVLILFSSCNKKKHEPFTVKVYDINSDDYVYADFYVDLWRYHSTSFFDNHIHYEAIFHKSPRNELKEYPELLFVKFNSISMVKSVYEANHYMPEFPAQTPITNPFSAFQHINFSFYSKQLGDYNQITETDEVFPTFIPSFTDTLYLDRSVINTFTVNNTTTNYSGAVQMADGAGAYISRAMPLGISQIKMYPSEIKNMALGVSSGINFEFYKSKRVVSAERNYNLNIRYIYSYPIKVIN